MQLEDQQHPDTKEKEKEKKLPTPPKPTEPAKKLKKSGKKRRKNSKKDNSNSDTVVNQQITSKTDVSNDSNTIEADYNYIDNEIFIYTIKSPCALCLNAYINLAERYPNLQIHVHYSINFYYVNPNVLQNKQIKKLKIYESCSIMKNYDDYYKTSEERILDCINSGVTSLIQRRTGLPSNLFFKQISIHSEYAKRIKSILSSLCML